MPLPTSLVVKNGSKARAATSAGMPAPVSPISTTTWRSSAWRADGQGAVAVHRVDGVVDQVGPHLVELAGVRRDRRHGVVVVAHDGDAVAQLVAEHDQGALEPVGDVDVLDGGAVELGVGLHGRDELGDPAGRLLHLGDQGRRSSRCSPPTRGRPAGRCPAAASRAVAPRRRTPAAGQRRGDHPVAVDLVVAEPVEERLLAVGEGDARWARRDVDRAAQRVEGDELVRRDPLPASCGARRTRRRSLCWSASTDRVAAEAGLLISWASPAARVPSVTSDSRWRALRSMRRAVSIGRASGARRTGTSPRRTRPARRRHPEDPARRHHPRRGQVDAVLVPGPEAAGPVPGVLHGRHDRVLAPDPADEVDAPGQQHPPVVGRAALVEQPRPRRRTTPPRRPRPARPPARR